MEELLARINAVARRKSKTLNEVIKIDELTIDTAAKTLHFEQNQIELTKKEFELLLYFVENKNRVVSKQSIQSHLWGEDYDGPESLDTIYVHTMNLRKKIIVYSNKDYIKTVYGMGYKWVQA